MATATASPILAAGQPGTTWKNDTAKVAWQYVCNLLNSCGQCVQYHMQVGKYWPIPLHRNCRCSQVPVGPGATSLPFADFREIIRDATPDQRARFVGSGNLLLIESGSVAWGDVVSAGRIRTLAEVVERKRLTVADLRGAGMTAGRARDAYASAHPASVEAARRSAQSLAASLSRSGQSGAEAATGAGRIIASRVSGSGPSGPQPPRGAPGAPPPPGFPVRPPGPVAGPVAPSGATIPVPAAAVAPGPPDPPRFGPSTAKVEGRMRWDEADAVKLLETILGRPTPFGEIASLVGAPDGSRVIVTASESGTVTANIADLKMTMVRYIKQKDGVPVIKNDLFVVHDKGKGVGSEIFASQVENAARLGVARIETEASRGDASNILNGYYTWPRLGYDGPLPDGLPDRPAGLAAARRVSDLMGSEEGRAWWKANGVTVDLEFDLAEGSLSRRTLDSYMTAKRAK